MQEEFSNAQENWNHNIDLLHHRSAELQEHYEEQGEDIGVFFEILGESRGDTSVTAGSDSMDVEDDVNDKEGIEGMESEEPGGQDLVATKVPHGFLKGMKEAELPMLPKGFEVAKKERV